MKGKIQLQGREDVAEKAELFMKSSPRSSLKKLAYSNADFGLKLIERGFLFL